jgi:hypothetical protein
LTRPSSTDSSGKAELRLHRPVPREISLVHDALWEGSGSGYHSVFQGRWHLPDVLQGLGHRPAAPGGYREEPASAHPLFCAYAESDDGIHWRKPSLGLHEFNGSKANNIVMVSGLFGKLDVDAGHPAVFKDENPQAAPDARYKALLRSGKPRGMLAFKSPDGLHWSPMSDAPIITDGAFDSQNLAFWDAERGLYRAYWRYFDSGTPDKPYVGVRSIRTATSKDFLTWENYADLHYADAPPTHLYTSQIKPYYRAPHLLLGFPARYIERELKGTLIDARGKAGPEKTKQWSPSMRALPELAHRELRASASERYGTALTETVIMASRDGVNFKRWHEAFLPPGIERAGTWHYGHQYVAWQCGGDQVRHSQGAPNELSLYAVESYWTDHSSTSAPLHPAASTASSPPTRRLAGGELVTKPIRVLPASHLTLNFASSAAGGIRGGAAGCRPAGRSPGSPSRTARPMFGDTHERPVTWTGGADLRSLAGRAVRIRLRPRATPTSTPTSSIPESRDHPPSRSPPLFVPCGPLSTKARE